MIKLKNEQKYLDEGYERVWLELKVKGLILGHMGKKLSKI